MNQTEKITVTYKLGLETETFRLEGERVRGQYVLGFQTFQKELGNISHHYYRLDLRDVEVFRDFLDGVLDDCRRESRVTS